MSANILIFLSFLAISQGEAIRISPRIVNGENAQIGEFPYIVSLQKKGWGHFCGGSIINENYILSAAHCIAKEDISNVSVLSGTVNLQQPYVSHKAVKFIIHEDYYARFSANDIALIKIEPPMRFTYRVHPVALPVEKEYVATNTSVVVAGWGNLIHTGGIGPNILQKASIYVADQDYCITKLRELKQLVRFTNICAYDPSTRRGQCNGDSGGPLTIGEKLIGVVSYSQKVPDPLCASTVYPGVYTRVSEYVDWIQQNAV